MCSDTLQTKELVQVMTLRASRSVCEKEKKNLMALQIPIYHLRKSLAFEIFCTPNKSRNNSFAAAEL